VLASLVLLLTACAPEAPPAVAPSPTLSPEPASASLSPISVFDLDCPGILSVDEAQAFVLSPIQARRNESTIPFDAREIILLQRGSINCHWGGDDATGGAYDTGIMLTVAPNAPQNYASLPEALGSDSLEISGTSADQLKIS